MADKRTDSEKTSSIRATPRSGALGKIADAAKALHNNYLKAQAGYDNPVTNAVSEFLGIPAFAEMMDRMSYGESPFTGKGQTLKPKDWVVDGLLSLPAGASAKMGTKGIETAADALKGTVISKARPSMSGAMSMDEFAKYASSIKVPEGKKLMYHTTDMPWEGDIPRPNTWFTDQIPSADNPFGQTVRVYAIPEETPMSAPIKRGRSFYDDLGSLKEPIASVDDSGVTSYVVKDPSILEPVDIRKVGGDNEFAKGGSVSVHDTFDPGAALLDAYRLNIARQYASGGRVGMVREGVKATKEGISALRKKFFGTDIADDAAKATTEVVVKPGATKVVQEVKKPGEMSRREFIKQSAARAGSAAMRGSPTSAMSAISKLAEPAMSPDVEKMKMDMLPGLMAALVKRGVSAEDAARAISNKMPEIDTNVLQSMHYNIENPADIMEFGRDRLSPTEAFANIIQREPPSSPYELRGALRSIREADPEKYTELKDVARDISQYGFEE